MWVIVFVFPNEGRAGRWGGVRTVASGARAAAPAELAAEISGHRKRSSFIPCVMWQEFLMFMVAMGQANICGWPDNT